MYREHLAKCYRAWQTAPQRADQFFWITWAPFLVTKWDELLTRDYVREAVVDHRKRVFEEPDEDAARQLVDEDVVREVANRLWIIVLSEKQEQSLMMSKEHLGLILRHEAEAS